MKSDKLTEPCFLALDQGGHATRAILYSQSGEKIFHTETSVETLEPENLFVEHDPRAMLQSFDLILNAVGEFVSQQKLTIQKAGLATQRSSFIATDDAGTPLSNIISWQDRRAHELFNSNTLDIPYIRNKTGLFANAHYGASKMQWCLNNLKKVSEAAQNNTLRFLPLASFIMHHILVEKPFAVDPANGSRTLLMNLSKCQWDKDMLSLFSISENSLPQIKPTKYSFGHIIINHSSVPLNICTGDQNATLFSIGEPSPENIYVNAGTGAFILALDNGQTSSDRLLKSILYSTDVETLYVIEGTVNGAARALGWLADQEYISNFENDLPTWLDEISDPPIFINGIAGIGSPYWQADVQSHFDREANTKEKFVAVTESIIFLIQSNIALMPQSKNKNCRIFLSGGLSKNVKFCHLLANLSQIPVSCLTETEATAKGIYHLLIGDKSQNPPKNTQNHLLPEKNPQLQQRFHRWKGLMYAL